MSANGPLWWIAGTPWNEIAGTEKQLASALAEYREVAWVDPPAPVFGGRARGVLPSAEKVAHRISRVIVPVPPGASRPVIKPVAEMMLQRALNSRLREGRTPAAVIVAGPLARFPRGIPGVKVFFVTDDWVAGAPLMGFSAARIDRCMRRNLRDADLVAAVTPDLAERLQQLQPGLRVLHLPNGCVPLPAPPDGPRRKTAVLLGQLNERLDLSILEALATAGIELKVIGPRTERDPAVSARLDSILAMDSVSWEPEIPAAAIPDRLSRASAGITPYADTAFNRASFPLKTLDYLSAGLPVVATDLPAARWLRTGHVLIEGTAEGFVAAVKRVLEAEPTREQIAERQHMAREHSWDARARAFLAAVDAPAPAWEGDHFLITRFNLPTPGPESLVRARDGWLRERAELFERYCLPSVAAQTQTAFRWVIYFDPESPHWLRDRIREWSAGGLFTPIFRASVENGQLLADLRSLSGGSAAAELMTTNLDNDDGVAADFVERLQQAAGHARGVRSALYLPRGLILSGRRLFARTDRTNAFCSVVEPWAGAVTCWAEWHTMLGRTMPVREVQGPPGWLQVVHGGNVSNRIRGVRVPPENYRGLFPGLLSGAEPPSAAERTYELLLGTPRRAVRSGLRTAAKTVLLQLAGKDGIDRVKEHIGALKAAAARGRS
ncbi:glycosyltransferase [Arthrobacter sp. zg-Y916]|uniref:glycosyltransferase n=1 Tax=Arthrobacter sp. zg-Y916 TaxID=2894190 RepID=UPI001E56E3A8|nr:glycosyltransferase [Arthrobacter sp. zg-Y916]MCC9194144.1 glycosyltransferase [Arthrobacter sp. zg-Y916]